MNVQAPIGLPGLPITGASPIRHPGPPPARADVVIIGGGIVGVSTALFLARRGLRPLVLEKGRIAGEQSARNWGWIRKMGRDLAELPVMIEAQEIWRDLAAEIGNGLGLERIGLSYLAEREADLAVHEDWLARARGLGLEGLDSRMLSAREAAALFPGAARRIAGGLHTPSDMKAEPWVAVPLIARLAEASGARLVEGCAARLIDIAAGRVAGVVSEAGRVACDAVLLAGGAWSSLLLRRHGILLPQLSVQATVCATEPLARLAGGAATLGRLAFRPRADGGYTLAPAGHHEVWIGRDALRHALRFLPALRRDPFGRRYGLAAPAGFPDAWGTPRHWEGDEQSPFERMRILDPVPSAGWPERMAGDFAALFPQLGEVRLRAAWAGMIDVLPDVVPVIDRVEALPGLWLGTGLSGHGFGIGPGFGRILADLISGGAAGHELGRFRHGRFFDGSAMVPGPGL